MQYIDVERLTEVDIKFLTKEDIAHFTTDQLAKLSFEQLESFYPDQFEALNKNKIYFLINQKRTLININEPLELDKFIDFLNKIPNLDMPSAIREEISEHITNNFIRNLNEFNPKYIPYINIQELEFDDLKKMSPREIKKLTRKQISDLSNNMIKELSREQIQAFSPQQISYFSPEQIRYFFHKKNFSFLDKFTLAFPPEQIQNLSLEQLVSLINCETLNYFNLEYIENITDNQIKYLIMNNGIEQILKKLIDINSECPISNTAMKNRIQLKIKAITDRIKNFELYTAYSRSVISMFDQEFASVPDDNEVNPSISFISGNLRKEDSDQTEKITIEKIKSLTDINLSTLFLQKKDEIKMLLEEKYKNSTPEEIFNDVMSYKAKEIRILLLKMFEEKKEPTALAAKATKSVTFNLEKNLFHEPLDAYRAVKEEEAIDWERNQSQRERLYFLRRKELLEEKRLKQQSHQPQDKATTYEDDTK
jgi:hypothetical protein